MPSNAWLKLNIIEERSIHSNKFFSVTASKKILGLSAQHKKKCATLFLRYFISSFQKEDYQRISLKELYEDKLSNYYPEIINLCPKGTEKMLENTYAPKSGAHGDLSWRNIIMDEIGEFHIIDWEMYNPNGSYAVDAVRFLAASMKNKSSAPIDISQISDELESSVLLKYIPAHVFFLVYILERAHVEIFVRQGERHNVQRALKSRLIAAERHLCKLCAEYSPTINLDHLIQEFAGRSK